MSNYIPSARVIDIVPPNVNLAHTERNTPSRKRNLLLAGGSLATIIAVGFVLDGTTKADSMAQHEAPTEVTAPAAQPKMSEIDIARAKHLPILPSIDYMRTNRHGEYEQTMNVAVHIADRSEAGPGTTLEFFGFNSTLPIENKPGAGWEETGRSLLSRVVVQRPTEIVDAEGVTVSEYQPVTGANGVPEFIYDRAFSDEDIAENRIPANVIAALGESLATTNGHKELMAGDTHIEPLHIVMTGYVG